MVSGKPSLSQQHHFQFRVMYSPMWSSILHPTSHSMHITHSSSHYHCYKMWVLSDSDMAVMPAVPATQDDDEAGGVVNGMLKEGEFTSVSAPSLPSPIIFVIVAPSMTHLAASLPANNASSPPPEKPNWMKPWRKHMYFGGEPCCKMGVSEGEKGDNESVIYKSSSAWVLAVRQDGWVSWLRSWESMQWERCSDFIWKLVGDKQYNNWLQSTSSKPMLQAT